MPIRSIVAAGADDETASVVDLQSEARIALRGARRADDVAQCLSPQVTRDLCGLDPIGIGLHPALLVEDRAVVLGRIECPT
jgi:hypothetical protein